MQVCVWDEAGIDVLMMWLQQRREYHVTSSVKWHKLMKTATISMMNWRWNDEIIAVF